MDAANQREYFRYTFRTAARPGVEITPFRSSIAGPPRKGHALDLSISGVVVELASPITPHLLEKVWDIWLMLPAEPDGPGTLHLQGTVATVKRAAEGYHYAFEFFGIDKPSHNQQRQVLWQFLRLRQKSSLSDATPAALPTPRS